MKNVSTKNKEHLLHMTLWSVHTMPMHELSNLTEVFCRSRRHDFVFSETEKDLYSVIEFSR